MTGKPLAQGAEAKITEENGRIRKDRFEKTYRIPEIDSQLRKRRTNAEAKLLQKAKTAGIPVPAILEKRESLLVMEKIEGKKLRDILTKSNATTYGKEMGELITKLHDNNIIHGDLTTSNMIVNDQLYFIDFGLGFISTKIEDKAVDLHLLRQALESKHNDCWQPCFKAMLKAYTPKQRTEILARFEKVEARGRNKEKY